MTDQSKEINAENECKKVQVLSKLAQIVIMETMMVESLEEVEKRLTDNILEGAERQNAITKVHALGLKHIDILDTYMNRDYIVGPQRDALGLLKNRFSTVVTHMKALGAV